MAALAVVSVGGCELLTGASGLNPDELANPSPIATYTSGTATIALGDRTKVQLTQLHGKAALYTTLGATASWENADGWYLQFNGGPSGVFGGTGAGYLTIDRIHDGEHWATRDPTRCIVDVAKADATALNGSATCKGLEWQDAVSPYAFPPDASGIPGQKPFDATITFEARP